MRRVIIELDKKTGNISHKDIGKTISMGNLGKGKIVTIYSSLNVLPKKIEKIREAIKELNKKGITNEMLRVYISNKYGISRGSYDMVVKGLTDVIKDLETERKINKLKE